MKTFRALAILVSFILVALPAFGEQTAAKLRVGVILPLSGGLAEYGVAVRNGIAMASADQTSLFKNIDFIFEDSQYDPKKAIAAFNKLRAIDKVDFVFDWGSATAEALAPIVEVQKFPLISMAIDPSASLNKKYVLRFANHSEQYIKILLGYLRSKKLKKIGIIKTELAYFNSMVKALEENIEEGESISIIDTFQFGDNDFKSSITKLKYKDFDAIGVYLVSGQISQFYRQVSQAKYNVFTFGTDFFESKSEIFQAGGNMEGSVYPFNPINQTFHTNYIKKYNNDNQIGYAANGYDFANLVASLFGQKKQIPAAGEIIQTFMQAPRFEGVVGPFEFTQTAKGGMFFNFPIVMKQIIGDSFREVS